MYELIKIGNGEELWSSDTDSLCPLDCSLFLYSCRLQLLLPLLLGFGSVTGCGLDLAAFLELWISLVLPDLFCSEISSGIQKCTFF